MMSEAKALEVLENLKPFLKEAAAELGVNKDNFEARSEEVLKLAVEKNETYMLDIAQQRTEKGKQLFKYISEKLWREFNPGKYPCMRCGCQTKSALCEKCEAVVFQPA